MLRPVDGSVNYRFVQKSVVDDEAFVVFASANVEVDSLQFRVRKLKLQHSIFIYVVSSEHLVDKQEAVERAAL